MNEKLIGMLIMWYEDTINYCNRITSGNISHNSKSLRGYLLRVAEYLKRHYSGNEEVQKEYEILIRQAEKCDRLTTGNYMHDIAGIKSLCDLRIKLLKKRLP